MIGGATVECTQNAPREMAFVTVTPEVSDAFLLSSSLCNTISNFMHKSTSFLDCVIEGNGRNEGTVPFIPSEGYRALHSGRKALIG